MTNIFLVRYRDGGTELVSLPVKNNKKIIGELTTKGLNYLIYRGYAAWVNLSTCYTDPRYKLDTLLTKEFGI